MHARPTSLAWITFMLFLLASGCGKSGQSEAERACDDSCERAAECEGFDPDDIDDDIFDDCTDECEDIVELAEDDSDGCEEAMIDFIDCLTELSCSDIDELLDALENDLPVGPECDDEIDDLGDECSADAF